MRPDSPRNVDVIRAWIETYLQDLHTAFAARVQHYDAERQTADLVPVVRHAVEQPDGSAEYEDLPVLPAVPVLLPRTAEWFVGLPIDVGDTLLVVCLESAHGHWEAGDGSPQYPGDLRRHHLAHAVALAGYFPRAKSLRHARPEGLAPPGGIEPKGIVIGSDADDGPRVTIAATGDVIVKQGSATVLRITPDGSVHLGAHPAAQFVALAQKVDDALDAIKTAHNTHKHASVGSVPDTLVPVLLPTGATKVKAT